MTKRNPNPLTAEQLPPGTPVYWFDNSGIQSRICSVLSGYDDYKKVILAEDRGWMHTDELFLVYPTTKESVAPVLVQNDTDMCCYCNSKKQNDKCTYCGLTVYQAKIYISKRK